jgi:cysteine synthase A
MIDLTVMPDRLERTVKRARERNIIIPTFAQMKDPSLIPDRIKEELRGIGLWDITSRNLFRITWKNEPVPEGGGFNGVNTMEFPTSLTGVPARIVALVGKWFPPGSTPGHRAI